MATKRAAKKTSQKRSSSRRKAKVTNLKARSKKSKQLSEKDREELVLEFRLKARKLARSILRKWHARLDLQEVDSVVDLSLCEAVRRFDPTRGASFITFLYYHLRGNLIRTVSAAANANAVPGQSEDDEETSTYKPTSAVEIAEALSNHDIPTPDEVLFRKELVGLSHEACAKLDPLEREVIERIYLEEDQLMDIARSLGYSRCHISRVKKKALETLQVHLTSSLQLGASKQSTKEAKKQLTRLAQRKRVHRRKPRSKASSAAAA